MKMIWKFAPQETKFLVLYLHYTYYFCVIVGHKWHTEYLTCSRLTITYSRSVFGFPFTWITVQCTKQTLAKSFLSSELGGNFGGTIYIYRHSLIYAVNVGTHKKTEEGQTRVNQGYLIVLKGRKLE